MFKSIILVMSFLALVPDWHKRPAPKILPSEKETCSVRGLVVRVGTSLPLEGAHVYLDDEENKPIPGFFTRTDATGRFLLDGITAGRYGLRVEKAGYLSNVYGAGSSGRGETLLTLGAGTNLVDLVFRMIPWSIIAGRIVNENGEPIPNVEVSALRSEIQRGQRHLVPAEYERTNDLGEFRLYRLSRGDFYVRAEAVGEPQSHLVNDDNAADSGYVPTYYPGTPDLRRAVPIAVASGQEVSSVTLTLTLTRGIRIRGRVFDRIHGRPVSGCCVFLSATGEKLNLGIRERPVEIQSPDGKFQIDGVSAGSYRLTAAFSDGTSHYIANAPVEVFDSNIDDLNLVLMPGIDLTGRLLVEGKAEIGAVRVLLEGPDWRSSYQATVKIDGSFNFSGVSDGTYVVSVERSPRTFFVKSVQINDEDLVKSGLTITGNRSPGALSIVISTACAFMNGVVVDDDGAPVPGATISLVPSGARRQDYALYKDGAADQDGNFVLSGISPGRYKLFAWKQGEGVTLEDPEALESVEDKGTEVEARENGHLTINVKVISADLSQAGRN